MPLVALPSRSLAARFAAALHAPFAPRRPWLAGAALLALAGATQAYTITAFSPQGEVGQARQVVARFSEDMVRFGDPKAPAPMTVSCDNAQATRGQGRWSSAREWVYDFAADLPPGTRCRANAVSGFKSVSGAQLARGGSYQFHIGGPAVQSIRPYGGEIEEEQAFVLRLNGPATAESLAAHVWCAVDGLGERVPVRLMDGPARTAALQAVGMQNAAQAQPLHYAVLACNRRLPPAARVQLVYGQGVAMPGGVLNRMERRFTYTVREPLTASMSCERENAQAACLPVRPVTLHFSAPVPRRLAELARLSDGQTERQPQLKNVSGDADALVESIEFAAPLPERAALSLSLPPDLKDASGRPLSNAASFPLKLATGPLPPLAKFAAAPFGIVERFAEGPGSTPLLPLTLRRVEPQLPAQALHVQQLNPQSDADIIAWFRRVQRYNDWLVPRAQARKDVRGQLPPAVSEATREMVESRTLSLLAGHEGLRTLAVPAPDTGGAAERPFEVVGVPMTPGFHVLELTSQRLGQALLDEKYGAQRAMVVRTSALVTNLGVHFKLGREDSLAWVTTLDKGQPVAGAAVRVSDCRGKEVASAITDAQGIARFKGLNPQAPSCEEEQYYDEYQNAYFVSARAQNQGVADMAFTWSSWQKGIESWRFNVPTSTQPGPDLRAHTVLDRTLLRAGETVSMKHLLRTLTGSGFGLPARNPATLVITHVGSGQQYTQPLQWRDTASGGRSAESRFDIPAAARLGEYRVSLRQPPGSAPAQPGPDDSEMDEHLPEIATGSFRVEEFRLPVMQGRVGVAAGDKAGDAAALVAATEVPVQVQLNYVAGGAASGLPVRVSAITRDKWLHFADHQDYSFAPPRPGSPAAEGQSGDGDSGDGEEEGAARQNQHVVADRLPLTLNQDGLGQLRLDALPPSPRPRELLLEASYADPNGEVQTLRSTHTLWPAAVVPGIKAESWVSTRQTARLHALALGTDGQPQAGVPLQISAQARITTTSRKRMVGGFYTYDSHTEIKNLGTVCSGASNAQGVLACDARLEHAGEVELVVTARDAQARTAQAAASVWVTGQGELWFGGENHDRMDLLAEKKRYEPGDTARFQVRMPFRHATALVAVEREGILHTEVVQLRGSDPTVSLKVQEGWGPNVYVSVLALRGRLLEVPWYSFFTWGFKSPREWWRAFREDGKDYVAPTALVDLSKPAFRLGMAEIRVGTQAHQLDVSVKADKDSYPVRGTAQVTVQVKRPDGQPAAHAEVALAAVDQALLELMPNTSWRVLEAMLQRRDWGVETATAQMEIVGRRHYGRKAVPTGGDGGRGSPTRELLDTLLLWQPRVPLDAQGQATLQVPLNDALSTFQIVAVADAGTGLFGTGQASIRTTQDLQIISGLPPLVRAGDVFSAQLTLRNTTAQPMQVAVTPRASLLDLPAQTLDIPAGQARQASWQVSVPAALAELHAQALLWEVEAVDQTGGARDALKFSQRVLPAVPLTVQQATLVQLGAASAGPSGGQPGDQPDGGAGASYTLPVAPPADALAVEGRTRGGVHIALTPRLADGLPGVRDWFARYPHTCLEQQTSRAIGLRDEKLWQQTAARLPAYLDGDGLAYYFPPRAGDASRGSDILTAWLLAATHEAGQLNPAFALPDDARANMIAGLAAFVEGRIERKHWAPREDLDVRKLAAIEALSRHGAAKPAMLSSIRIAPAQWPTSALIDWINILKRLPAVPNQRELLSQAEQNLRARLSVQGTRLGFDTEASDHWWWLMAGGDVNAARLLMTVMDDAAWKDDLGRLVAGFIARQQGGAWATTTANLWGSLALERFSRTHESAPVTGFTLARLGSESGAVDWSKAAQPPASVPPASAPASPAGSAAPLGPNTLLLPWGSPGGKASLSVTHEGSGKPWLTVQSLAAVALKAPFAAGYQIRKTITPVQQADKTLPAGQYSQGDVLRITLDISAQTDMTWVAVSDPVPTGATILGGGLGRDSAIATLGEQLGRTTWPTFEERAFDAYRAYYEYLPKGSVKLEYTVRLNNAGQFQLPPTRAEALYAPEVFGEIPNAGVSVRQP